MQAANAQASNLFALRGAGTTQPTVQSPCLFRFAAQVFRHGLRLVAADGCCQLTAERCDVLVVSTMDQAVRLDLAPART